MMSLPVHLLKQLILIAFLSIILLLLMLNQGCTGLKSRSSLDFHYEGSNTVSTIIAPVVTNAILK